VAGGAIYEVATIQVTVGGEEVDIGRGSEFGGADAEEDVDDQKELTLNIIKNHNLKKQEGLTKKDVKSLFKNYCKKLKEKLEELIEKAADDDYETKLAKARFASFKEHFPKIKEWFDTDVIGNFDDYDFYSGDSMDLEAMLIPARYIGESVTPCFYFIKDGLREEKC